MTRGASSSSSSSFSDMATTTPSEKGEKYSVKGTNKQQEDKASVRKVLLDEYSIGEASW